MQKLCARYHRFSDKDQSVGSIERQEMITSLWCNNNDVLIVDTFNDDGHSAKNFDRPDAIKLFEFLRQNKGKIQYLAVAELTRFSRRLGDAVNMVEKIQNEYGIHIVSAGRGMIYDVNDSASFMMMSIEFAQGNSENIKRENDINGGIYTAKAREKRFIGARAPYGYKKEQQGKFKKLVIVEEEAAIVRYVFNAFLHNTSMTEVIKKAREMGYNRTGNSKITYLLTNPIYISQQFVKAWKKMPGGLFPVDCEPIVDVFTFHQVQKKFDGRKNKGYTISDFLPLRGLLNCHCGKPVTGAASRGKSGAYFDYYKCKISGHNNISAKKAHQKLDEMLGYLSLPGYIIDAVKEKSEELLQDQLRENKQRLAKEKALYEKNYKMLLSVEEKWINEQLTFESYSRWHTEINQQIKFNQANIDRFSKDENQVVTLLHENLQSLGDMQYLYNIADTTGKRQLIGKVFDYKLYYQEDTYRTPYLMEIFKHNELILNQKRLLVIDKKRDFFTKVPSGGAVENRTRVQTYSS